MTSAAPDDTSEKTFRLMYRSHSKIPEITRKQELGVIFGTARSNNKKQQITGALLLSDDWFVQVLEGEEAAVRALYTHIETDPRHDRVSLLETEMVDDRVFSRWAMARVGEDDEDPDIPLIANRRGITAAAGRATTPEQDLLLDHMREAARTASA